MTKLKDSHKRAFEVTRYLIPQRMMNLIQSMKSKSQDGYTYLN